MFAVALIVGSSLGETLALTAGDLMMWGIALASIGVLAGLIFICVDRSHSLITDKQPGNDDDEIPGKDTSAS